MKTIDYPGTVEELSADLARNRDLASAHRADELARLAADAEHKRHLADVAETTRRAELDRSERESTATAAADLARVYREALDSGERTRIAAHLARSGEARALRLERLRTSNLKVLVPVLIGFALWSTTGVQQGAALLMRAGMFSPTWWVLWVLEPVLIGAVVWVIVARARLAASGGVLAYRATQIAAGCLATSVGLNMAAATQGTSGHTFGDLLTLVGAMAAHAVGPVGAAATAHLIGVIDESIAAADPWTDAHGNAVPLLADLGTAPQPANTIALSSAAEPTDPAAAEPLSANRPRKRPASGRKSTARTSPRTLSDAQLSDQLAALVEAGRLTPDAPIRQVQAALGIGFDRAKRLLTHHPLNAEAAA